MNTPTWHQIPSWFVLCAKTRERRHTTRIEAQKSGMWCATLLCLYSSYWRYAYGPYDDYRSLLQKSPMKETIRHTTNRVTEEWHTTFHSRIGNTTRIETRNAFSCKTSNSEMNFFFAQCCGKEPILLYDCVICQHCNFSGKWCTVPFLRRMTEIGNNQNINITQPMGHT